MLRHVSVAAFLFATLTACGSSSDNDSTTAATASTGFVFTALTANGTTLFTNLYRLNPETFEIEKLLTGESGDAVVYTVGSEVLLFNRSLQSLNYRRITPDAANKTLKISDQTNYAGANQYDPHAAIEVGTDLALLAQYSLGKLSLMKVSTGEKLGEVTADWDLPANVPLNPETLWRTTVSGKTLIYVVHHASAYEGNLFTVNGTQTVFVLEQNGSTVTAVDLDPTLPKVQGIKIQGSFAQVIESTERAQTGKLVLSSLCSRLLSPSQINPANVCKNVVEEIDPATQTVKTLWDLDNSGLYMNGSTVSTGTAGVFYAQVEEQTAPDTFVRRIVKLDPYAKTKTQVYDYAVDSGGYYGLYYDDFRGNLFIGDINSDSVGKFTILKADGTTVVKSIDAVPYSGTFIY
ncbi:MAG: hypothetical protein V4655_06020 [Bdellovibrionota bacterium]